MKKAAIISIVILLCAGILFQQGRIVRLRSELSRIEGIKRKADTLYVRDTITLSNPTFITRTVIDTFKVEVRDTLRERDTLYLTLPIEQKVYADSTYRAVVSGYRPNLDEISVFPAERVVLLSPEKPKSGRFGIGVQAGYGTSKDGLSPYIGIGVSYNLLTF